MTTDLPPYVPLVFGLTVVVTILFFHYALLRAMSPPRAMMITGALLLWTAIQSGLAIRGFYLKNLDSLPPRFLLILVPALVLILLIFSMKKGRVFVSRLPIVLLTHLSIIRVPVELVLYWLFLYHQVPELMTFAGRNFDILAGLTAPLVAYFGLQRSFISPRGLILWNVIALGLLLFIVANAILSTPTPVQQFAFDQPNLAIFYFPFVLLPAVVVPIVLFSHLASLYKLYNSNR